MKINDARNLMKGEIVITKIGNEELEVISLDEFIPAITGKRIIYVKCKDRNGDIRKFSHKELLLK